MNVTPSKSEHTGTESKNSASNGSFVKGANLLQHFNVRCPACSKLYRVSSKEIKSSQPHFECVTCDTKFTFDYPPQNLAKIETRVLTPSLGVEATDAHAKDPNLKECPKCGTLNPQLNTECARCQVIMAKAELVAEEKAAAQASSEKSELKPEDLATFPSLVKAWKELFSDYGNLKKHLEFVDRCEDLQALPFALKKYQTLKEAQPHDVLAQRMVTAVLLKTSGMQKVHSKIMSSGIMTHAHTWVRKVNWKRVQKLAPLAVSFGFILYGVSNAGARNLVGMGAAILFLTIGLTIFIKGRISFDDFW